MAAICDFLPEAAFQEATPYWTLKYGDVMRKACSVTAVTKSFW